MISKLAECGRWLVTCVVVAVASFFVIGIIARFTPQFASFTQGSNSLFENIADHVSTNAKSAWEVGWPLGLLLWPLYCVTIPNYQVFVRKLAWVIGGAAYFGIREGGYVHQGDWAELIIAPVGVIGAFIESFAYKLLWQMVPKLIKHLHSTRLGGSE